MQIPYRKPGKYTNLRPDPLLTESKFNELKKELERLKRIQPRAVADARAAAEHGDFSENAEYQLAKGRLRAINGAIMHYEQQLKDAEIFKPEEQTDIVCLGHRVTVETDGKQKTFLILGSTETNPQSGVISHHSPVGAALIGKSVGDVIKIKLANREVDYKIIKIEK